MFTVLSYSYPKSNLLIRDKGPGVNIEYSLRSALYKILKEYLREKYRDDCPSFLNYSKMHFLVLVFRIENFTYVL